MDYSKKIKSLLETESFSEIVKHFDIDTKESILNLSKTNPNILCSNNSFLFIYFEQSGCFLALSLNHLCKSQDSNYLKSFQRLSLNSVPIGKFKKCIINQAGTYILLVYDKILTCIELPTKWGKYDQFDAGKSNIICKSIKFKLHKNVDLIDAIWHPKTDDDCVVCLTNDHNLKFFRICAPNTPEKEYHLTNINFNMLSKENLNKNNDLLSFDMGSKFEYNNTYAYPIYILKSNSEIECLIEYESRNFEYIGPLELKPCPIDETEENIISFICLPGKPNCIVTLSSNGNINHCILITNTNDLSFDLAANLNDDDGIDENAVLYVYEKMNPLENLNDIESAKLFKDPSDNTRYLISHSNGLHTVYLAWLENLRLCYENENLNDFKETDLCDVKFLVSTNPFHKVDSSNFLVGLTIIFDFGKTSRMLVCLDNQEKFLCLNIETPRNKNSYQSMMTNKDTESEETEDVFTNYIESLIKRDTNMPVLMTKLENNLTDSELKTTSINIVNLIRNEYIEKQKKVLIEFQKRCKLLKQQEKIQDATILEIKSKLESLTKNKQVLMNSYSRSLERLKLCEQNLESVFNKIFEKINFPLNQNEIKILKELKATKLNLNEIENQIRNKNEFLNRNEKTKVDYDYIQYDEQELSQIKFLLKNESEKLKDLIKKIEVIKSTVSK